MDIEQVKKVGKYLLQAIDFLHGIDIIHTDIRPENVCMFGDRLKIIDLGGATHKHEYHSRIVTTRQYRAPEIILQSEQWNHKCDIWSVGCLLIELFTTQIYFDTDNDEQHIRMINSHQKLGRHQNNKHSVGVERGFKTIEQITDDPQFQCFLKSLLEVDPNKRISAQQALLHNFII